MLCESLRRTKKKRVHILIELKRKELHALVGQIKYKNHLF